MKLLLIIYGIIFGKDETRRIKKSLIVRSRNFKLKNNTLPLREKLAMIIFFNKMFFSGLFKKSYFYGKVAVFDFEDDHELRIGFMNYFNAGQITKTNLVGKTICTPRTFYIAVWLFCIVNLAFLIWLFKTEKYSTAFIPTALRTVFQITSLPLYTKAIFFLTISVDSYWASLLYGKINQGRPYNIASNSPLFTFLRYSYLPGHTLILCASYQHEEYNSFKAKHWLVCDKVELWGLEEEHLIGKRKSEPVYDLAFFSSAEWMRNENLIRIKDMDVLRKHPQVETKPYLFFQQCMEQLLNHHKTYPSLKIVYCFHPAEIKYIRQFNQYPPYWDSRFKDIATNIENDNSLALYNKIRIGVSTMSTATFDLWHLGIKAFVFSGRGFEKIYQHGGFYDHLTNHKKLCFHTPIELGSLLNSEFN